MLPPLALPLARFCCLCGYSLLGVYSAATFRCSLRRRICSAWYSLDLHRSAKRNTGLCMLGMSAAGGQTGQGVSNSDV